jgi:hypothetical protein
MLFGTAMAQQFAPVTQIVNRIDESQLTTLKGNTVPAATAANDRGRVSQDLQMTDMILVLSRSPEQQAAFDKFVASQYAAGSPEYHHWLAADEVGAKFGPSETDIATVSNWLTGHGLEIAEVSKDHMSIRFSGTAGQVESAFHTEIHNLEVNGVPHIANMSDPKIPTALVPAVVGAKGFHNFFPTPMHRLGSKVTRSAEAGKFKRIDEASSSAGAKGEGAHPLFTVVDPSNGGLVVEDVVPYDFATIYNVLPLWNATSPIDGTGQKIAIAGTSDINLSDVAQFRSTFGLPANPVPQVMAGVNGSDPGVCTGSTGACTLNDLIENSLDVEWSGAVAKGAQIILVTSGSKSVTDDAVYDSSNYVIQNKTAPVLNVSYGECELFNGAVSNTAYNNLWQTAATEGIAVFVAAGDEGSAGCDAGNSSGQPLTLAPAQNGLAVSGLASSPYDTAIGGTDFNWCNITVNGSGNNTGCSSSSPYRNSTNTPTTGASAVGYVPEVPWNDTCTSPASVAYLASFAAYLGVSGVNSPESGCNFVANNYVQIYQAYQYDISFFVNVVGGSGGASNCSNNTTTISSNGNETVGTCTNGWVKPGYQTALTPTDGVRDLPDVSFFAANGFWNSSYLMCVSEVGAACVTSTTTTTEPVFQEVGGTSVGSPAMAGVMALINQKTGASQGSPNAELYKLAGQQTYSSCSSEGPPGSSCYFHDVNQGTMAMPCLAGTPNCNVITAGDTIGVLSGYAAATAYDQATGLGSLNVANVVNAFVAGNAATVTVTPASTTINSNLSLGVTVTVASSPAGGTTPTGTVELSGGGITANLMGTLSNGSYAFTVPANTLTVGTDTLTVNYSGDSNYAPTSGTGTVTVTAISEVNPTVSVLPAPTSINSSQSLTVTGAVTGTSGIAAGTVVLTGGGYTSSATTLSGGAYSIVIPGGSLSAGTDTLAVAYTPASGSIYAAASGTANVTVTASVVTLAATAATISSPGGSATSTVTVTAGTGASAYAGTVTLTCALTNEANQGDIDPPSCSVASGGTVTLSSGTTSGTGTITINSTAASGALVYPKIDGRGRGWAGAGGGAILALLLFFGMPARRRSWRSMIGMLVLLAALGSLAGCGGGGSTSTPTGTTPDTYTFTVTGTGSPAVSPTPTITFSVTVQ